MEKNTKVMLNQLGKLVIENGILLRKVNAKTQVVLPEKFHGMVLHELHNKMGHLGVERLEELARSRFYWPYMRRDVNQAQKIR
jgi:hypothetical protein